MSSLAPITVRADVASIDERAAAAGVTRSEYLRKLIDNDDGGVWVAYYPDMSGIAVYETELDALRAATSASMEVKFVKYGEGI